MNPPSHSVASIKETLFTLILNILNGKQKQRFFFGKLEQERTSKRVTTKACNNQGREAQQLGWPTPSLHLHLCPTSLHAQLQPTLSSPPDRLQPTAVGGNAKNVKMWSTANYTILVPLQSACMQGRVHPDMWRVESVSDAMLMMLYAFCTERWDLSNTYWDILDKYPAVHTHAYKWCDGICVKMRPIKEPLITEDTRWQQRRIWDYIMMDITLLLTCRGGYKTKSTFSILCRIYQLD